MKKAFIIVLLVAALGITLYYINQLSKNKPGKEIADSSNHELLIGKWKLDSIVVSGDSVNDLTTGIIGIIAPDLVKYQYEFKDNGAVAISIKDSLIEDSSRYEWNKNDQLIWKEYPADTTADVFAVSTLNKDSLVLASDSASLLFTRLKE